MATWNGLGSGKVLNLEDPDAILQATKGYTKSGLPRKTASQDYLTQLKERREQLSEEAWASLKTKDFEKALSVKSQQELVNAQIQEEERKTDLVKEVEDNLRRETLERKAREAAATGEMVLWGAKEDSLSVLRDELSELRFGSKIAPESQIAKLRAEIVKLEQEIEDAKTRADIEKFYGTQANQQTAIENGAEVEDFLASVLDVGSIVEEHIPPVDDLEALASWQEAVHYAGRKGKGKGRHGSKAMVPRPVRAVITCSDCGTVFPNASAKFCAECGAKRPSDKIEHSSEKMQSALKWAASNRTSPAEERTIRVCIQQKQARRLQQQQLTQRITEIMDELEMVDDSLLDLADTCGSEKTAMEEKEQELKAELIESQRALNQLGDVAEDEEDDEVNDEGSDLD